MLTICLANNELKTIKPSEVWQRYFELWKKEILGSLEVSPSWKVQKSVQSPGGRPWSWNFKNNKKFKNT